VALPTKTFDFETAVRRMRRLMWWFTGVGTAALAATLGGSWAAGFLTGALIAQISFQVTHRFVLSIGGGVRGKPATWKTVLVGARYLIIAAVIYAMMKLFGLNILAALCGLLVAAAAALIEILYELIHGTS
jgi:hypothetical protein